MPAGARPARLRYAEWLTAKDNPFFAKSTANRVWSYFFGRGIIDPVDDIRASNPPSNPALLDALTKDFVDHDFDLRHLMRTIANSRTYQACIATNEWNAERHRQLLARHARGASSAEAVDGRARPRPPACGRQFPEAAAGDARRAGDRSAHRQGRLPGSVRPAARESSCECERRSDLSLPQALNLVNGRTISDAVADANGRVAKAVLSGRTDDEVVDEICTWRRSSRPPAAAELESGVKYLQGGGGRAARAQDLLWALVNSKAFLYNRNLQPRSR